MRKIVIEKHPDARITTWVITMYKKESWWKPAQPIAQWREHSKKVILRKATQLLEQFHKLDMEFKDG